MGVVSMPDLPGEDVDVLERKVGAMGSPDCRCEGGES